MENNISPTMTPLERAAREIAPYLQGGRIFDDMPKGRAELKAKFRTGEILDINDATQSDALECAGAVLLAIREPSEGMILSGVKALSDSGVDEANLDDAKMCHLAMIDKALEEG